jgi:uncharacterized protein
MARINYVELPARDIAAAKQFYTQAFGWELTDFGPSYAATLTGDVDLGLHGDMAEATKAPLAVIDVADLEAAQAKVEVAGARIVRPIFAFPGGRRFHFLDPNGNELAVVQADPH